MRFLLLLFMALAIGGSASRAHVDAKPEILILEPGNGLDPAARAARDSLIDALRESLDGKVDFSIEYIDSYRFPGPAFVEEFAGLLQKKYGGKHFDLILALGPTAYRFVAERREETYLDAPLVFVGMRETSLELLPALPNSTGILSKFDLEETVKLAQILQPDLRNLYVITGDSPFDRSWEQAARRELASPPGGLEIHYLAGLALGDLMVQLSTIPPRSALLYLSMFRDGAGQEFIAADVAGHLAEAAPVYGVYSSYLDRGIVGGHMDTFESVGKAGARLILRVLQGADADSIAPHSVDPLTYVVNWPMIEHWRLDPARLPPETIIRNKPISIWDEYKEQILVFMTLLVLQSLLIVALMIQSRGRRRTEVQLAESEDRMRLAASAANLGLWRWESQTNRVWMTDHCRAMLGLMPNRETTIRELLAAIHREDQAQIQQQIERSARWHTPFDTECRIVLPDESVRWMSIKGQSTRHSPTTTNQVTGVVIDISERKSEQIEAEQHKNQLTHLTRVAILGELSGAMAHELNQPLAAILSNAQAGQQLLRHEPPDLAEIGEVLADIVADDLRAGEVIQRQRSLLKRDETRLERLDLSEVMAEVLHLARSELLTQQVNLENDLDPELPAVQGDPIQLQQVLLNLVMNACEAMGEMRTDSRVLTVTTREGKEGEVEVVVRDSGPGIPEEILSQLFEPFSTTKQKGLGLGLAISRAIIAAHHGHIEARNNDDGGAAFTIRLPSGG